MEIFRKIFYFISFSLRIRLFILIMYMICSFAIGVFVDYHTNIRKAIAHKIFNEQAIIKANTTSSDIAIGDYFVLDISIFAGNFLGIEKGNINIKFDNKIISTDTYSLRFTSDSTMADIENSGKVHFLALRPGKTDIVLTANTDYGTYEKRLNVNVVPTSEDNRVNSMNFSATWHVIVNEKFLGEMTIRDHNPAHMEAVINVDGMNIIDEFSGIRDGSSFNLVSKEKNNTRWVVRGIWLDSKHYIQVDGTIYKSIVVNGEYMDSDKKDRIIAISKKN